MDILKKLKNKSFFLKSISVIISIVIILSVFAVSMIASADNPEIWDGTKASSYAGGEGTKEKPYLIENGAQLYKMVAENATSTNGAASTEAYKYYKITKDIHLNDVKDQDLTNPSTSSWDAKGFKPWLSDTTQSSGFCGQVDGGGFTVYGLYCKSGTYSGLITSTVGAKVFDLNVKNAFVKGNGGAGGIIGQAYGADAEVSVSKCTVDNVYIDGGAKVRIGGIVGGCEGSAKKVEISDCSVTRAKLVTTHGSYPNIQSGLLGYTGEQSKNHKVTNCFTDGTVHPVTDTANTTHFKKFTNYITYTNVYTSKTNTNAATGVTVLTDDKMKGENAKTNLQGFDFDNVWEVKENAYPVLKAPSNIEVWDGTWVTDFSSFEGAGTEESPYLIENGAQLAFAVAKSGEALAKAKHYKLVKDIILNDTSKDGWEASAHSWVQNTSHRFNGELDGDGHTIEGLYWNKSSGGRYGLFAYTGKLASGDTHVATIKNITFKGASVSNSAAASDATQGAAIVAGQASGETVFENIIIDETSTINAPKIKGVAGLVARGYNNNTKAHITIINCAVNASITGGSAVGAFTGTHWDTAVKISINNSYSSSNVALVGGNSGTTTITNSYGLVADSYGTNVLASADLMKGDAAKTNMSGLDFEGVWKTVENGYPVLKAPSNIEVWDGTWVTDFSSFEGDGTEESPYLIENGAQLAFAVAKSGEVLSKAKHYKLVKDIILNDTSKDGWEASAHSWVQNTSHRFNGELDGDGHTIEGLYWNKSSGGRYGLFAYTGKLASGDTHVATIKNITFKGASVSNSAAASDATQGAAIVAGQASGETVFENIIIDETSTINAPKIKGVAGLVARGYNNNTKAHITIINCAVNASITGGSAVGAFTGTHWDTAVKISINNSYSSSNVALVGGNSGTTTITNSYGLVADSYGTNVLASADLMKGDAAKTNMSGLDFEGVWKTVENGYPVIEIREVIPKDVWDGTKAASLTEFKGEGTKDVPYEIENASQLAYVVSTDLENGLYFKLVKDIKINHTAKANWKNSARNWVQNTSIRAVLNLDGDGHTIDGLYFNTSSARLGLFAYIGDSVIENIKFTNASINHTSNGEGIAIVTGQTSATSTFNAIYIDETCEINAPSGVGVAAISGRGYSNENAGAIVTNSAVLAKITGSSAVGAFIGTYWYSSAVITVNGCFSNTGLPIRGNNYGTTNAESNYGIAADNYNTNVLSSTDLMKGDAAKTNMSGLDFYAVFETVDGKYPIINYKPELLGDVWDGKIADSFAGGSGTSEDPFLIENGGQLYKMVAEYSSANAGDKPTTQTYFRITKDINLGNRQWYTITVKNWLDNAAYGSIGFNGVIYGDGHTIKNLSNAQAAGAVGLIPVATQGAQIYDLHLDGGNLPRANWQTYAVGAFIGLAKGANGNTTPIVIKGCSVKNFKIASCNGSGGFVGYVYSQSVGIYNSSCVDTQISHTAASSANSAGFIGYTAGNEYLNTIVVANSYCVDVSPLPYLNEKFAKITTFSNVYTNFADYNNSTEGIKKLTTEQMKGENAKQNMHGFDFVRAWATVENDYPAHLLYVRPDYVWDGTTATSFAGGTGAPTDPYLIENGAQLYKMVSEYSNSSGASGVVNKCVYFKLTKDIYLNDVTAKDLESPTVASWNSTFNSWYKVTSYSKGFSGDLDGDGFTVYGLYSNGGYSGLIPVLMDGGSIHNLNIKNSYVYGTESAGGLVGFVKAHWKMAPVSVTYCTVDNVKVESTKRFVGGIVGGFGDIKTTVSDCSVTRSKLISTNENPNLVAGFIGNGWGDMVNEVTNCFTDSSVNPVTATSDKESFDSIANKIKFTNVYTTAKKNFEAAGIKYLAKDSDLQGLSVESVLKGFNFEKDWTAVEGNYPAIRKNAGVWKYDYNLPGEVWSGKTARYYNSGDGTKENPYEIKTGGQLALLANDALNGKTLGRYYKLTEDIILNDTSKANWQANAKQWFTGTWAKAFRGHLDGDYHIISGLYLNKTKNNYNGADYYGGLFACISRDAVIEKLGIVNSSLTFTDDISTKYLGAFAGFVDQYDATDVSYDQYPIIRECFADTSVYLNGGSCGGFIGCATRPIRVEDSFFTGTVAGSSRGLFGYSKMNKDYDEILVKNFYTAHSKYAVISNPAYDNFKYENCYSSSAQDTSGLTRLFIDRMCGTVAKQYMKGFDFEKVWAIRGDKETPGLKGFKADKFSNVMNPEDIVVNFESNCDLLVDSVTGKAYSKLKLPVLKREGYVFDGWYAYPELDVPFTYDYFPTFNTILYAKWTLLGFAQDFEQYEDTMYDYHEDYEYYRPTVANYSAKYVHGGGKSMHRLGASGEDLDFLLFYNEELEIGKKYKMVFYTTTDQNKASVKLSLVHLDWPDVYTKNNGVENIKTISNLKDGKWQEVTFTFVARSKWIAIRTSGNNSVYFDDFTLFDIGKGVIKHLNSTDDKQNGLY